MKISISILPDKEAVTDICIDMRVLYPLVLIEDNYFTTISILLNTGYIVLQRLLPINSPGRRKRHYV